MPAVVGAPEWKGWRRRAAGGGVQHGGVLGLGMGLDRVWALPVSLWSGAEVRRVRRRKRENEEGAVRTSRREMDAWGCAKLPSLAGACTRARKCYRVRCDLSYLLQLRRLAPASFRIREHPFG